METNFSKVLVELRTEKELTQRDLAHALNIDKSTVGKYEKGVTKPSIDILILLADFFEVTTDYLLGREK